MKVNISEIIDNSKFGKIHFTVLAWCIVLILFDGYDLAVLGAIIPTLHVEWDVSTTVLGFVGSLTLIGSLIGSLICGVVADKIGRKNVIVVCIAIFGIFTFINAFATNITQFAVFRFLAGIGLGGIPPLLVTLTSEYSPKKIRNLMIGVMFSGYSIGGILVSLLGMQLLPMYGWQSLFYIGALPIVALPFIVKTLPESLYYMVKKGEQEKAKTLLNALNPSYLLNEQTLLVTELETTGMPIKRLFQEKRTRVTLLFWMICFMGLLLVYGLTTWLPQIMVASGFQLSSSLSFLLCLNIGAIIGSIIGGMIADKIGTKKVLMVFYLVGGLSLISLAFNPNIFVLYLLIGCCGAASIGAQNLNNAYISTYFPSNMKSTALGTSLGIGRLGGIVGPTLGGLLLASDGQNYWSFIAFSIPAFLAFVAYVCMPEKKTKEYGALQAEMSISK